MEATVGFAGWEGEVGCSFSSSHWILRLSLLCPLATPKTNFLSYSKAWNCWFPSSRCACLSTVPWLRSPQSPHLRCSPFPAVRVTGGRLSSWVSLIKDSRGKAFAISEVSLGCYLLLCELVLMPCKNVPCCIYFLIILVGGVYFNVSRNPPTLSLWWHCLLLCYFPWLCIIYLLLLF